LNICQSGLEFVKVEVLVLVLFWIESIFINIGVNLFVIVWESNYEWFSAQPFQKISERGC